MAGLLFVFALGQRDGAADLGQQIADVLSLIVFKADQELFGPY
jgi:hypothetical protein